MTDNLADYPLPEPRQLFRDPGEAHTTMLQVFAEQLKTECYIMPADEFVKLSFDAWQVRKAYAPSQAAV